MANKKYPIQYFEYDENGDCNLESKDLTLEQIKRLMDEPIKYDGFVIKYKKDWYPFEINDTNKLIILK